MNPAMMQSGFNPALMQMIAGVNGMTPAFNPYMNQIDPMKATPEELWANQQAQVAQAMLAQQQMMAMMALNNMSPENMNKMLQMQQKMAQMQAMMGASSLNNEAMHPEGSEYVNGVNGNMPNAMNNMHVGMNGMAPTNLPNGMSGMNNQINPNIPNFNQMNMPNTALAPEQSNQAAQTSTTTSQNAADEVAPKKRGRGRPPKNKH